jgi:hypothetical protein
LDGGRKTLGHYLDEAVEVGQFCGGQEREHPTHRRLPGTGDPGQKPSPLLTEATIDHSPVVFAMAADRQAATFHAIDEFGGGRVRDAERVGKLTDRDGPALPEHEQQPQLTEREVVVSPVRRTLRHQLEERICVRIHLVKRYGLPGYFGHTRILWHIPQDILKIAAIQPTAGDSGAPESEGGHSLAPSALRKRRL